MDRAVLKSIRAIIRAAKWKHSTSAEYRTAPHSYLIAQRCGPEFKVLADAVRAHGVYRTWRGNRTKYLILDGKCYWVMWPVLNRADAGTLDPLPKGWDHVPTATELKRGKP
jgi:hypothetical protein